MIGAVCEWHREQTERVLHHHKHQSIPTRNETKKRKRRRKKYYKQPRGSKKTTVTVSPRVSYKIKFYMRVSLCEVEEKGQIVMWRTCVTSEEGRGRHELLVERGTVCWSLRM